MIPAASAWFSPRGFLRLALPRRRFLSQSVEHNDPGISATAMDIHDPKSFLLSVCFFQYRPLETPAKIHDAMRMVQQLESVGVKGRTYVSIEGINAQLAVPYTAFPTVLEKIESDQFKALFDVPNLTLNVEPVILKPEQEPPFHKLTVKHRPIVADDVEKQLDVKNFMGRDLSPEEWHRILEERKTQKKEKDLLLIDTRNWYESDVGKFADAIPLGVDKYKDAFAAIQELLKRENADPKKTKVMMYCTGGIRCVKLSTYLRQDLGFEDVNQLRGGIISYVNYIRARGVQLPVRELVKRYTEDKSLSWLPRRLPAAQQEESLASAPKSQFLGKNFVFDERMGEKVTEDVLSHCHQCGNPSDIHRNCANPVCNILFIQCPTCHAQHKGACSAECRDIASLPEPELTEFAKKNARFKKLQNPSAFNKNIHVVKAKFANAPTLFLAPSNGSPPPQPSFFPSSSSSSTQTRNYTTALEKQGVSEYCDELSTPIVPLLRTLADETKDLLPESAHMMISSSQSMLLTILTSAVKAKRVLEIGCFTGFSAISMAQALPTGGKLITLEVDKRVAEIAQRYVSKSPELQEKMEVHLGPAVQSLSKLSGKEVFDIAFIDADKKNYQLYYNMILEAGLVRKGGLILVDNVLWKGMVVDEAKKKEGGEAEAPSREKDLAKVMHQFNREIKADRRTRKVILPIRDGMAIMEVL